MNNEIDEQWVDVPQSQYHKRTICQVSNTGKYRRNNGEVGVLTKCQFTHRPEQIIFSHFIAEHFLITVRRPDQNCIDHITHTPTEYNINDIRNLRWCSKAENNMFEEAVENRSKSRKWQASGKDNGMYGRTGEKCPSYGRTGDKSPSWKGDKVSPKRVYRRALKLYKAGLISESELQKYRDARRQYEKEHPKK